MVVKVGVVAVEGFWRGWRCRDGGCDGVEEWSWFDSGDGVLVIVMGAVSW